jgi:hypothetical protein
VVQLVAQAKLNKEIAHELHLTEGTIKEYLNRIFRKLGTTNRTELAVWALTHPGEEPADASSDSSGPVEPRNQRAPDTAAHFCLNSV